MARNAWSTCPCERKLKVKLLLFIFELIIIEDHSGGRSTRSKKKVEKFADVPFSQIALETLASEWTSQREREEDLDGTNLK